MPLRLPGTQRPSDSLPDHACVLGTQRPSNRYLVVTSIAMTPLTITPHRHNGSDKNAPSPLRPSAKMPRHSYAPIAITPHYRISQHKIINNYLINLLKKTHTYTHNTVHMALVGYFIVFSFVTKPGQTLEFLLWGTIVPLNFLVGYYCSIVASTPQPTVYASTHTHNLKRSCIYLFIYFLIFVGLTHCLKKYKEVVWKSKH